MPSYQPTKQMKNRLSIAAGTAVLIVSAALFAQLFKTIDSTLQYYCERELEKCVEQNNVGNSACAVIMDAKTGAVRAMASYPEYDLNGRNSIYSQKDRDTLAKPADTTEDEEAYNEKKEN